MERHSKNGVNPMPTKEEIQRAIEFWVAEKKFWEHENNISQDINSSMDELNVQEDHIKGFDSIIQMLDQMQTEPCSECQAWKKRNDEIAEYQQHYAFPPVYIFKHCPDCGRRINGE